MTNTAAKLGGAKTTFVPVTTMEEVPVLSDAERDELIASLKQAEQDIADGKGIAFTKPGELRAWLAKGMKEARQKKQHGA
jgi:hypothetical protein